MDDSAEEAKVSIHCGGTDIYIVPNGRAKRTKSPPLDLESRTGQELPNIYSPDLIHVENKEAMEKSATENGGRCLLPYVNRPINIKTNGKKNSKTNGDLDKANLS